MATKKIAKEASERSEDARAEYRQIVDTLLPELCVFVDESAIDRRTTFRTTGYAPYGERAPGRSCFVRGERSVSLKIKTVKFSSDVPLAGQFSLDYLGMAY